jgi:hypothetical protein
MSHSDYIQQLEETVRRQELELIKCREWMDSLRDSLDAVRSGMTTMKWNSQAMKDIQGMQGNMVDIICDYIREQAPKIAEEEIRKIHKNYGTYDDGN